MLVPWYLRRAIPWMALLGCCAGAVVLAVALDRWPSTAPALLPALLGACAAAAAFSFDEPALEVVAVTPRGATWRRTARLATAAVPLLVWSVLVLLRPGDLPLARGAWLLIGAAAICVTAGLAAVASRHAVATPGGSLAGGVVLAVISPVVITAFLDWESVYPFGHVGPGLLCFWSGVAGAAALACLTALRPGLRV